MSQARAVDLFNEALALPPAQRADFVRARCSDPAQVEEVVDLLRWHVQTEAAPSGTLQAPLSFAWVLRAAAARLVRGDAHGALPTGTKLGAFRLAEKLDAGATSVVYRAFQETLGDREVALKVCSALGLASDDVTRFRREAAIAARLDHPNLVQVYDSGEDRQRGVLFYAMRLVRGASLAVMAAESPGRRLDVASVCDRVREAAAGLAALHEAGLVHRDVKPGNILVEVTPAGPRAVVVDFGQVQQAGTPPHLTRRWTPAYAAPEIVAGHVVDARADVFGLGATLYDLLSGASPADQPALARTRTSLGQLAPHLDARLVDLVTRALAADARLRPPDGGAVVAELAALATMLPVSWRVHRRRRLLVTAALILASLCTAACIAYGALGHALRNGDMAVLRVVADWVPAGWAADRLAEDATTSEAIVSVLRVFRSRGELAAARHLVAYLARDGAERHPVLVRLLERGCTSSEPGPYWDAAARLLLERPARSAAEREVFAGIARQATALLQLPGPDPSRGHPLTALAGCGRLADVPALVDFAERRSRDRDEAAADEVRLACRAVEAVVSHEQRRGMPWPAGRPPTALVQRLSAIDIGDWHGAFAVGVENARAGVVQALCAAARAAGDDASARACLAAMADPSVYERAMAGDPSLRAELAHWPGSGVPVPEPVTLLPQSAGVLACYRFGLLVGAYGDPVFTAAQSTRLRTLSIGPPGSESRLGRGFAEGCAFAEAALRGLRLGLVPDAGTGLVASELTPPPPFVVLAAEAAPLESGNDLASWNFRYRPAAVAGEGATARTCAVQVAGDEVEIDEWSVVLGVPGVSAVELSFVAGSAAEPAIHVELYGQLAARQLRSRLGDASLAVTLDGRPVLQGLRFGGPSEARFRFTVGTAAVGGPRRLRITLQEHATTTVRLYGARVFCRG